MWVHTTGNQFQQAYKKTIVELLFLFFFFLLSFFPLPPPLSVRVDGYACVCEEVVRRSNKHLLYATERKAEDEGNRIEDGPLNQRKKGGNRNSNNNNERKKKKKAKKEKKRGRVHQE